MSITRVRIEAEGSNHAEVLDDLNQAFGLFYGCRWIPRESEFVEEIVESHIRSDGAIQYKGRRVIKFYDGMDDQYAELDPVPDPSGSPTMNLPWVISGSTISTTVPSSSTVWTVANATASSANINPVGTWEIRDSAGAVIPGHYAVGVATGTHPLPWYFHPSAGHGG